MTLPLVINPGDSGHISHHGEIHAFLAPIVSPFDIAEYAQDVFASRPAAGIEGRFYRATDTGVLYIDSGSGWVAVHDLLTTWEASLLSTGNNLTKLKLPSVIATKTVAQTLANNSDTVITFPTEDFDNDGMHSISSNTGRLTALRAGVYLFGANLDFEFGSSSFVAAGCKIRQNGSTIIGVSRPSITGNFASSVNAVGLAVMAVNDYVEVLGSQTQSPAANADLLTGRFWGTLVSST